MKVELEIPDDLWRRVEEVAAMEKISTEQFILNMLELQEQISRESANCVISWEGFVLEDGTLRPALEHGDQIQLVQPPPHQHPGNDTGDDHDARGGEVGPLLDHERDPV